MLPWQSLQLRLANKVNPTTGFETQVRTYRQDFENIGSGVARPDSARNPVRHGEHFEWSNKVEQDELRICQNRHPPAAEI